MIDWHGYCLWAITTPLTNDTLNEDGVVTNEGTKTLAKRALLELGKQSNSNPCHITHLVPSINKQKYIIELVTPSEPTNNQFYTKIAEYLPYTAQQIANNSSFHVSPGNTWEERRVATVAYLRNNSEEWEPAEV